MPPPRKDVPLTFKELLGSLDPLCSRSRYPNHQEMFCIGFLFAKFKLSRFEDLEFLYNVFSVLSPLISDGLINI